MTHQASHVSVMPLGTRWPSGTYTSAGVVALDAARVEEVARCALHSGSEPGLGPWVGIGVALPSGQLLELVQHLHAPKLRGFEVRVDSGANCREVFAEFLRAFNVNDGSVLWVLPECEA